MSKFRFPLARLKRVRDLLESSARAEVAEANALARSAQEAVLARIASHRQAVEDQRATRTAGALDVAHELRDERHVDACVVAIAASRERAKEMEARAVRQRAVWTQRKSDSAALEKLEHKSRGEHVAEDAKRELEELDEVAARRNSQKTQS